MSSINKQSIREELEKLEAKFAQFDSSGKVSPDLKILFHGMLLLIKLLLSIFMEKETKKNSKNSSKPPSQTDKDETTKHPGTKGKGKLENKVAAKNTRTVENITVVEVLECPVCGKNLRKVKCEHYERRTKIDIVFEKVVEHVDVEVKTCPVCETKATGPFPADMPGPKQYGVGLKTYVINLLVCQMVALNRVQKMISTICDEVISQATLLNFSLRLYKALEQWEVNTKEKLLTMPAINVDETSLRVDRKNHWIHVYAAEKITLKFLHPKRGKEAIEDINILPRYGGTAIHDCWASYLAYSNFDHGLCCGHLLRELTFVVESNGYAWAKNMKRLLKESCRVVSKKTAKKLSLKEYANLQKRYRNILTRGEKELPVIPVKSNGARGKIAKSDAHNLWERFKKYESSVLLFALKAEVSFTNNRAERDLRMSKVKQKVSGCFRTDIYAKAYCRISSYLQTMANEGHNPLVAIEKALANQI